MINNYFIIHGSFGSPFVNWIPYLRKGIEDKGLEVYTPDFPTGVGYQNYENWERLLKVYFDSGLINENTIIFAHSIAPVAVSKFLIENKIKVKRLVFVCGFNNYLGIDPDFDAVNESMFTDNLQEIKDYCPEIICYYSDNDPYVKFDVEKEFADTITTRQHIIKDGGHINAESVYTEFEEILKELI